MLLAFLLFQQWQVENASVQVQEQTQTSATSSSTENASDDFVPASSEASPVAEVVKPSAKEVTVTTDVFRVKINSQGGDITEVALLDYDTEQGSGEPYVMLQNGARKYIAQSGLTGANGPDRLIPGRPIYQVEQVEYQLNGQDKLDVNLTLIPRKWLRHRKNLHIYTR